MKSKSSFAGKYIYSGAGIVAALLIAVAVNVLARKVNVRVDMTEDRLYSLSNGTKNVLRGLKSQVTLRFYRSASESVMPVQLRPYATKVEDLLKEYVVYGGGKVALDQFDPSPDSDAEESAKMDGVSGQMLRSGDQLYFGLAVSCLDKTVAIPFLNPNDEKTLEYDLTRAVFEVANPKKRVIGMITPLPVLGGAPPMAMMGQQQNKKDPPWIFIQEMQKVFDIRNLGLSLDKIPDDVDVLFVFHPKNIAAKTKFAIDQYLLKGGRLVVAVDPYCFADAMTAPEAMYGGQPQPGASSLPELFAAWGFQFCEASEIVLDPKNAYRDVNNPTQAEHPSFLTLGKVDMDTSDIVMSNLSKMNVVFAGAFRGKAKDGIKQEILLHSSKDSELYKKFSHQIPTSQIMSSFKSGGAELPIALRLSGNFETAFPEGAPKDDKADPKAKKDEPVDAKKDFLAKSVKPGNVILIGDVDLLFNPICVNSQKNIFGQPVITILNSNLSFIQNAADQLSGDDNLINIRCRGTKERPFTVIQNLFADAQKKYQKEIAKLEEELKKTEERINALQQGKSEDQKMIISAAQKEELKKFKAQELKSKKELRLLRKDLRKEVDHLEMWIQIVNVAAVPFIVVILAIGVGLRRRATAATPYVKPANSCCGSKV